jgi:hypothetical protein
MPAVINSAPDCVIHSEGYSEEDIADFILNDNYADCASIMTFGPGSTYGPEGTGAEGLYMVLTWVGIVFMIVALIAWVYLEHRRLMGREIMPRGGGTGGNT